jgi:hypothetical protein
MKAFHWIRLLKLSFRVLLIILGAVILLIISQVQFPAGIETIPTQHANALLFPDTGYGLPRTAEITIDGVKAVFHQGDKSYDKLVDLLHNGRSEEILEKTGYPSGFNPEWPACGELVIPCLGIPCHFPITREKGNPNFYRIWLPKLTSPGRTIPTFTADPQVVEFIKSDSTDY